MKRIEIRKRVTPGPTLEAKKTQKQLQPRIFCLAKPFKKRETVCIWNEKHAKIVIIN